MPRVAMKVDLGLLLHKFKAHDGNVKNQNMLWTAVADDYNKCKSADLKEISAGVVRLRVLDGKWEMKTPKGKRGRSDIHLSRKGPKVSRVDKWKSDPAVQASQKELLRTTITRFKPLALKVLETGSLKAAVALNCIECSGWSTVEVRNCATSACALWPFRPYQGKKSDEEETEELKEAA